MSAMKVHVSIGLKSTYLHIADMVHVMNFVKRALRMGACLCFKGVVIQQNSVSCIVCSLAKTVKIWYNNVVI